MVENDVILTTEQKAEVHRLYNVSPDLILITKKIFDNEELDGRSKEGRAVRKFLIDQGLKYRTTKKETAEEVILLDHHQSFIKKNCMEMSAFQIAKVLFPESNVLSSLSKESRAVIEFLRENEPDKIKNSESGIGVEYTPPSTLAESVILINRATVQDLSFDKLSSAHKQDVLAYIRFVNSPRIVQIINSYMDETDRDLFESEFTRFTWDKPDLTADDIALYIGVCQDIVTNKRLVQHLEKMNQMFDDIEENQDLTIRISDAIKAKSEEYDKVQKRIESILKKLSGDRSVRLQKQGNRTANFLSLVEAFQSQEERKRMLLMAKAKREEIKDEADRLESLDDFKARILGISKHEVL